MVGYLCRNKYIIYWETDYNRDVAKRTDLLIKSDYILKAVHWTKINVDSKLLLSFGVSVILLSSSYSDWDQRVMRQMQLANVRRVGSRHNSAVTSNSVESCSLVAHNAPRVPLLLARQTIAVCNQSSWVDITISLDKTVVTMVFSIYCAKTAANQPIFLQHLMSSNFQW